MNQPMTVVEICAGGGGQVIGLERAGFHHVAVADNDPSACATLRQNLPSAEVLEMDIHCLDGKRFRGVDLLAGGVPCPPFSIAGKQLGAEDERDLFPVALRLIQEAAPKAVLLENVKGLAAKRFQPYLNQIIVCLKNLGYRVFWRIINAQNYGVPQLRPRFVLVALSDPAAGFFYWPEPAPFEQTVAEAIGDLVGACGWPGLESWKSRARSIAPTIVGGSKKHGGPDLGPTRARKQWSEMGIDGLGIANHPPPADWPTDRPFKLTLKMTARIQGFPDEWSFAGNKTSIYRQIGNAFPPPVAEAVGGSIRAALSFESRSAGLHYPQRDLIHNADVIVVREGKKRVIHSE